MLLKIYTVFALTSICLAQELFKWQDCGGTKFHVDNITISPLPLKLSETTDIFVSAKIDILEDLPVDAVAETEIVKLAKIGVTTIQIPLPCIDGDLGSCTLKVCDLFTTWYKDILCPFIEKAQKSCVCPVTKGVYAADNVKVDVPFAKIKGLIAKLASGDYDIHFRITDPAKKINYGCVSIHANIVSDEETKTS